MSHVASFEIDYLQYLDADGRQIREFPAALRDPAALLPLFRQMLYVRAFDTKAIALQRTGKLGTYAPCLGHEATHVGIGAAMAEGDVYAPSYREYGVLFMRGVRPREVLLYWGGDERGNDFQEGGARHDFPFCVPISTQCLHAAGAALAFKLRGEPHLAVATCGDGGSSKTDFYAALNSAGAWDLPLVLGVINNGWAISVPRSAQTGAQTLAQKGIAGGLFCLQVDGNDLVAVLEAMRIASERARSGQGGSVIEFMTYRLSDHTTADDARRYRDEAEVKDAWAREPIARLRTWLTAQGAWSEAEEAAWKQECERLVAIEVDAYLATPVQPVEAMFDYLYADPPPELLAQRAAAVALDQRAMEQRHG
jgi:pyruvate dehydrogenase E1 component alpha subunit